MHASPEAIAMAERQRRYDYLHHKMRIEWLESLPHLNHDHHWLLQQSRSAVTDPCECVNSVDVEDAEYVAELDAFAAERGL